MSALLAICAPPSKSYCTNPQPTCARCIASLSCAASAAESSPSAASLPLAPSAASSLVTLSSVTIFFGERERRECGRAHADWLCRVLNTAYLLLWHKWWQVHSGQDGLQSLPWEKTRFRPAMIRDCALSGLLIPAHHARVLCDAVDARKEPSTAQDKAAMVFVWRIRAHRRNESRVAM